MKNKMLAKCVTNEGELHSRREVEAGNSRKTSYSNVTVGKNYMIYAVVNHDYGIRYLFRDDSGSPCFRDAQMFEIVNGDVPDNWKFRFLGYIQFGLISILGFSELVDDLEYYDGLVLNNRREVNRFNLQFSVEESDEAE